MLYRLVILNGPMSGHRVTIPDSAMTVGRASECDLVLPDEEAALDHVEIRLEGGALHFRDLGSMSGTLVNQVDQREGRLKHGDVIEVGHTRLLVEAHVQAEVPVRQSARRPFRGRVAAAMLLMLLLLAVLWVRGFNTRSDLRADSKISEMDAGEEAVAKPEMPSPEEAPAGLVGVPEDGLSPGEDRPVTDELRLLRNDIEALRDTMASLADEWIASVSADTHATDDVHAITAQALLLRARSEIDQQRFAEADRLLAGLQVLAPSFAEAWSERARLFEMRGRLAEAEAEWTHVREAFADAEWVGRATEEMERIGLARWEQEAASATVSIAGLTHRKFPASEGIAEMRTLTVRLVPDELNVRPNPEDISIEVAFFDREVPHGSVMPSPRVPTAWLRPQGEWEAGQPVDLVATYRVESTYTDGWLLNRRDEVISYFGCRVRLFIRGEMISEVFRPLILAEIPVATEAASVQEHR